jgi:coproporphyrinogen III oxidase-like Fe-S oxidoreductase
MMPISQINIGGDPLLTSTNGYNIEEQLRQLEARKQALESMKQLNPQAMPTSVIWNEIDTEVKVLSQEQLQKLFENEDYVRTYVRIQELVNAEILNLVKPRIESTPEGRQLLQEQLNLVRKMKPKIVEDTNREVELFRRFREFSKTNPDVTYEEFIKQMNV